MLTRSHIQSFRPAVPRRGTGLIVSTTLAVAMAFPGSAMAAVTISGPSSGSGSGSEAAQTADAPASTPATGGPVRDDAPDPRPNVTVPAIPTAEPTPKNIPATPPIPTANAPKHAPATGSPVDNTTPPRPVSEPTPRSAPAAPPAGKAKDTRATTRRSATEGKAAPASKAASERRGKGRNPFPPGLWIGGSTISISLTGVDTLVVGLLKGLVGLLLGR